MEDGIDMEREHRHRRYRHSIERSLLVENHFRWLA